ncbi:MAG: exosortase system-associated protein, TIGR04073 family [Verrucomicrobia bacterium]|nr:exosortase system-associated protein, TIGR04073 family [Verrucomicrobiota bacterium]MDE3098173.1 exosortase system-associated protein, TIGR04073 family [Verrucomicrobiota bacterium]
MRNVISLLALTVLAAVATSGCAGPEEKFGRGMRNTWEVVRMGEMRRSVEQTTVIDSPDVGYTTGFIRGLNRSLLRTGVGVYELVTFPIPPYHAVATRYIPAEPSEPDNYRPQRISDSMFDTDTYVGFSGGDVAPFIPGCRFSIFSN